MSVNKCYHEVLDPPFRDIEGKLKFKCAKCQNILIFREGKLRKHTLKKLDVKTASVLLLVALALGVSYATKRIRELYQNRS